ncbi:hypothetical protein EDC27_0708 [Desulfosoma caldarium]|uniref:Uncharacterized protein n=1 Tax=Desulfosoma caldarium TaxID=610254 RepID=A0A3N1VKM8_9BACT|nr:hypothetical protein EDC27_0708 [Desulfosoma caldarium]
MIGSCRSEGLPTAKGLPSDGSQRTLTGKGPHEVGSLRAETQATLQRPCHVGGGTARESGRPRPLVVRASGLRFSGDDAHG